jgi:hypothetical protein
MGGLMGKTVLFEGENEGFEGENEVLGMDLHSF